MPASTTTDPAISGQLANLMERAEARARADGLCIATVGYVVAEIVDSSARWEPDEGMDLSVLADGDTLRQAMRPGMTVAQVRGQNLRILADAHLTARSDGADVTAPRHYLAAAALSPGDQLPGLDGIRLLLVQAAGPTPGQLVSARMSVHTASNAASNVIRKATDSDNLWVRGGRGAYSLVRGQRRSYLTAIETIVLLPGLVIREALWMLLALAKRNQRWAVSALGVEAPSQLRDEVPTLKRASMEATTSFVVFAAGVLTLVGDEIPARLLSLAPATVGPDFSSDLGFVATNLLSGRGAFGAGLWLPWALLAVAVPSYEAVVRIRWGYQLHGGMVLRPWVAAIYALSFVTRPFGRLLGAIGLPASLAQGFVIIVLVTFATRAFASAMLG